MAMNVTFDSLKKELPLKIKAIEINGQTIEIKQYLPVNDKLTLISAVLEQVAQNEYPFANSIQMDVYSTLGIIYAYSNIEFSEEEKANPAELYDELERQDISNKIIAAIPEAEYKFVIEGIEKQVSAYYNYVNSVKGILETVSQDYSNLNFDATEIQKKIADPENLTLLKDVVTKLG